MQGGWASLWDLYPPDSGGQSRRGTRDPAAAVALGDLSTARPVLGTLSRRLSPCTANISRRAQKQLPRRLATPSTHITAWAQVRCVGAHKSQILNLWGASDRDLIHCTL